MAAAIVVVARRARQPTSSTGRPRGSRSTCERTAGRQDRLGVARAHGGGTRRGTRRRAVAAMGGAASPPRGAARRSSTTKRSSTTCSNSLSWRLTFPVRWLTALGAVRAVADHRTRLMGADVTVAVPVYNGGAVPRRSAGGRAHAAARPRGRAARDGLGLDRRLGSHRRAPRRRGSAGSRRRSSRTAARATG